jgi:signal transduction histidine kinase
MTFFGRSLSFQIAMVMALALLAATVVNIVFILSERERSGLIEASGPVITRFADLATAIEKDPDLAERQALSRARLGLPARLARVGVMSESRVDARNLPRSLRLEQRLLRALKDNDSTITEVRVATRMVAMRDLIAPNRDRPDRPPPLSSRRFREIVLTAQLPDGRWLVGDVAAPPPPEQDRFRLVLSTLVLFGAVLGAALWIAGRLARPLRDLALAAERVGEASPAPVAVRGPGDIRQTIEAFNAMSQRVGDLLTEKDVMLGAIGHDLRTPLTSLRIRLETMEPESEREKAIRTLEETSVLLETILDLARQGRSSEPAELVDLGDLVRIEIDAYAERGATIPLTIRDAVQVSCQPILFRRLVRNLIDNALGHGLGAEVSVRQEGAHAVLEIADKGPGMSPETLQSALRPFVRGEASRNRSKGGSGLGLALADAIAKAHGGSVSLANRQPTGLLVTVRLPAVS